MSATTLPASSRSNTLKMLGAAVKEKKAIPPIQRAIDNR
jgi:hypothetical protein